MPDDVFESDHENVSDNRRKAHFQEWLTKWLPEKFTKSVFVASGVFVLGLGLYLLRIFGFDSDLFSSDHVRIAICFVQLVIIICAFLWFLDLPTAQLSDLRTNRVVEQFKAMLLIVTAVWMIQYVIFVVFSYLSTMESLSTDYPLFYLLRGLFNNLSFIALLLLYSVIAWSSVKKYRISEDLRHDERAALPRAGETYHIYRYSWIAPILIGSIATIILFIFDLIYVIGSLEGYASFIDDSLEISFGEWLQSPMYGEAEDAQLFAISFWSSVCSGALVGIGIALIAGRLDSKYINLPAGYVYVLYLYAIIQIIWPFVQGSDDNVLVAEIMLLIALVCKVVFFLIMYWLISTNVIYFYMYSVRNLQHLANEQRESFISDPEHVMREVDS